MHPIPMNSTDNTPDKNVYPIQTLREIGRLMRKLNVTPAAALQLLAEVLADLDCQIEEYEEAQSSDLPCWMCRT